MWRPGYKASTYHAHTPFTPFPSGLFANPFQQYMFHTEGGEPGISYPLAHVSPLKVC